VSTVDLFVDETDDADGDGTTPAEPRRGRGGPPLGTRNNLRHGLTSGTLPPGCGWITRLMGEYRAALEAEVLRAKGAISVLDAGVINAAVLWQRHGALCQRWLRIGYEQMNWDQRLNYSREIARAASERDKAVRQLGIAREGRGIIDALYGTPDVSGAERDGSCPSRSTIDRPDAGDATLGPSASM